MPACCGDAGHVMPAMCLARRMAVRMMARHVMPSEARHVMSSAMITLMVAVAIAKAVAALDTWAVVAPALVTARATVAVVAKMADVA